MNGNPVPCGLRTALCALLVFLGACGDGSEPLARQAAAADPPPPIAVRDIAIGIDDPQLGPLTFKALAAGDPAQAGQGRLVLLLHGFPECDEEFRAILPALAALGYYAVAPSQRGYSPGARPGADSDYTLDHMVHDTLAMASALGADRFHLVGHDWGGGIAWIVGAQSPSRLKSLTVLSTPQLDALEAAGNDPLSLQREMLGYSLVFATPGMANVFMSGGPDYFALGLVAFGLPLANAEVYADALGDATALNAAMAWYRANPLPPTGRYGVVTVPTLYAWGNEDFAFGADAAKGTQQYVNAPYRFVELNGVNHWVTETDTAKVTQLIIQQVTAYP
jgi:pimeloyl-ACP methyl ester carboxylesterase